MMDVASASASTAESLQFRVDLLSTLASLPVPNKTMLLDSKLLPLVEKWTAKKKADEPLTGESLNGVAGEAQSPAEALECPTVASPEQEKVAALATQLLETWAGLKEVFRIPKKERLEKMKEHEREADAYGTGDAVDTDEAVPVGGGGAGGAAPAPAAGPTDFNSSNNSSSRHTVNSYERRPHPVSRDVFIKDKAKRLRESPDRDCRKTPRLEMDKSVCLLPSFSSIGSQILRSYRCPLSVLATPDANLITALITH